MTEQPRDPLQAFEVIDGPRKGEWFACERDNFDVLIGDPMRGIERRVRYSLRAQGAGHVWYCGIEQDAAKAQGEQAARYP